MLAIVGTWIRSGWEGAWPTCFGFLMFLLGMVYTYLLATNIARDQRAEAEAEASRVEHVGLFGPQETSSDDELRWN